MTTVTRDDERSRYEARDGDDVCGRLEYEVDGRVVTFTHTVVEPAFEGRGIGEVLVRTGLDDARDAGRAVVPQCPYVARWIEKHPDYADLLA